MPEWICDELSNLAAVIGSTLDDPKTDEAGLRFILQHAHGDLNRILKEDKDA